MEAVIRGVCAGVLLTAAWLAAALPARAVLYDFEDQISDFPPNLCGVTFVDGNYRVYDWIDGDPGVPPTNLGARRTSLSDLADLPPLVMVFDVAATSVALEAGHQDPAGAPILATLEAFDPTGALVGSDTAMVDGSITTPLSVSTGAAIIRTVHLTFGTGNIADEPARTLEVIDDLEVGATFPTCPDDTEPPIVSILYPPVGLNLNTDGVALVADMTDDEGLASLVWTIEHADGSTATHVPSPQPFGTSATSGSYVPPDPAIPVIGQILENGANRIIATACDTSNNCRSALTLVIANIPEPTLNFFTRAVEVTQGIQDEIAVNPLRRSSEIILTYPGLPLIARKTTAVRVYPGSEGTGSPWSVPVILHGTRVPGGTPLSGSPLGPVVATVGPGDTFNPNFPAQGAIFVLPRDWTDAGEIQLRAQVNPPNLAGQAAFGVPVCPGCPPGMSECFEPLEPIPQCNDPANVARVVGLEFLDPERPGLRVRPVPMASTLVVGSIPFTLLPANRAYLNNTYPIPDDPTLSPPGLQIDPDRPPLLTSSSGCAGLLWDVYFASPVPASLSFDFFTLLGTIGPLPSGIGCTGMAHRPGVLAWAWQLDDGATTAQEIGHNRNLKHASNWHGESGGGGFDPWPLPHGGIGWAGFDASQAGTARVVPAPTANVAGHGGAHDFMSYGGAPTWISARTYVRLLGTLHGIGTFLPPDRFCQVGSWQADCLDDPQDTSPCTVCYTDADCPTGIPCVDVEDVLPLATSSGASSRAAAATVDGDFLLVSGRIAQGELELRPVYTLPVKGGPADTGSGRYAIEVRDSTGGLVAKRLFDPIQADTHGPATGDVPQEGPSELFVELVPAPVDVASLAVLRDGEVLLERSRSPRRPTVRVDAPNGGESWAPHEPGQIRWTVFDPDAGDELTSNVYLSLDAGETWSAVALDVGGTELDVPADRIASSESALVRVVVSDGLASSRDESDAPFTILAKPKEVHILRPFGHGVHDASEPLRLSGEAWSLENGPEPVPRDGETLRFRVVPEFGGGALAFGGPEAEASLGSGIHRVVLELLEPGTRALLAEAETSLWVTDAALEIEPLSLDKDGLVLSAVVRLGPGATLTGKGEIQLLSELEDGSARTWDLTLEESEGRNGFPVYALVDPGKGATLATLAYELTESGWHLSGLLPDDLLPLVGPDSPHHGRLMLRLGDRNFAGEFGFDRDGDGRLDGHDNCPSVPNVEQLDADRDGAGDPCDNCPNVANPGQDDPDRNGVGTACQCGDVDGDGVTNVVDALLIARGEVLSTDARFGHCDVNGDGQCNVVDALAIARGEVGSDPASQLCPAWGGPE